MNKFCIQFQILLLVLLIFLSSFAGTIDAQTINVPFYCIGTNCTENVDSATSTPKVSSQPQTQSPCVNGKTQSKGSFFATLFGFIFSFFRFTAENPDPCSTSTPSQPSGSVPPITGGQPKRIQFIDHTVAQVPGRDMSITVAKPNNSQPGDILVAMIGSDYAHVNSLPSGWTKIRQDVKNSGHKDDLAMQSYYKVVTTNESATYTWDLVTARDDTPSAHQPLIAVDLYAFRGVDPVQPILSNDSHGETEDPNAVDCPSVKGIVGGMLVCAYIGDDTGSIKAPSNMTQTSNFEIAEGDTYAIAYEALNSNNETGLRTATWNNPSNKNGSDFAQAIVLQPLK